MRNKETKKIFLGSFVWENGSINSNIERIALERNFGIRYNHFGELELDPYGIGLFKKPMLEKIGETYKIFW